MSNGSDYRGREVRIPLNVAIAGTVTIVGFLATASSGMFAWHAAQRDALESRLQLALTDAIYTINQRDDRQDLRRSTLYGLVNDRIDRLHGRTSRMETLVLDRALERIVRDEVEEVLQSDEP